MKICFRHFHNGDFNKIRSILIRTYKSPVQGANWRLDRWNFAFSMSRTMNFTTIQEMENQIGIWGNENKEIVAVVNSEGEGKGEVLSIGFSREFKNDIWEKTIDIQD